MYCVQLQLRGKVGGGYRIACKYQSSAYGDYSASIPTRRAAATIIADNNISGDPFAITLHHERSQQVVCNIVSAVRSRPASYVQSFAKEIGFWSA
jgi:hypothetical protein